VEGAVPTVSCFALLPPFPHAEFWSADTLSALRYMTYWSFGLTAVVTFFKGFDSFTPKFKSVSRFLQFLVA
jgi:hypothetical protein